MSMLGVASGLAQPECACACALHSMVLIHEIPTYVHTGPSGLSSVGWCTIWVPTTHFLIDSKSIFCGKPCQNRHAFEIFNLFTVGPHLYHLPIMLSPRVTTCTLLCTLVPHFPGLVTLI